MLTLRNLTRRDFENSKAFENWTLRGWMLWKFGKFENLGSLEFWNLQIYEDSKTCKLDILKSLRLPGLVRFSLPENSKSRWISENLRALDSGRYERLKITNLAKNISILSDVLRFFLFDYPEEGEIWWHSKWKILQVSRTSENFLTTWWRVAFWKPKFCVVRTRSSRLSRETPYRDNYQRTTSQLPPGLELYITKLPSVPLHPAPSPSKKHPLSGRKPAVDGNPGKPMMERLATKRFCGGWSISRARLRDKGVQCRFDSVRWNDR